MSNIEKDLKIEVLTPNGLTVKEAIMLLDKNVTVFAKVGNINKLAFVKKFTTTGNQVEVIYQNEKKQRIFPVNKVKMSKDISDLDLRVKKQIGFNKFQMNQIKANCIILGTERSREGDIMAVYGLISMSNDGPEPSSLVVIRHADKVRFMRYALVDSADSFQDLIEAKDANEKTIPELCNDCEIAEEPIKEGHIPDEYVKNLEENLSKLEESKDAPSGKSLLL